MARARKQAASTRGATRSQSRKAPAPAAAVAEVEVVEEEGGLGLEDGIIVVTTLALVVACALIEAHLAGVYDSGFIF
ncbi:MAG: hypothetical protein V3T22_05425 [Planctomycetota bacterium]